jgi:hypothetical protein
MKDVPLFARVANSQSGVRDIAQALSRSADPTTADVARGVLDGSQPYGYDFETFRADFNRCLDDMIENGIKPQIREYLNAYLGYLHEEISGDSFSTKGSTTSVVSISNAEGPWAEGVVAYNLCLYLKAYGVSEIKRCKKCRKVFTGRGKYAVYCGDACKKGIGGSS